MVQQCGACTHDTGAQRTHEHEIGPVAATAGIADTDNFCVCSRVATLYSEVVSPGHNTIIAKITKYRANGQPTFLEPGAGFLNGLFK